MRVFITGATGLIGSHLVDALVERGDRPVALTRDASRIPSHWHGKVDVVTGDPQTEGKWMESLCLCDAVVNLAGEPVAGRRWNARVKAEIEGSRVESTALIALAIRGSDPHPQIFISASASGYYGNQPWEKELTEAHPPGEDYLSVVCRRWESASSLGTLEGLVRKVNVRISIVLDAERGALARMLTPFKLGLGGPIGNGSQPFPWIHIDDMAGIILWALDNPQVRGPLNACAPQAVTSRTFAATLGKVLNRPAFFPVPGFVLKLRFGEGAAVLLSGQRMVPAQAQALGYSFRYPELGPALQNLLDRKKNPEADLNRMNREPPKKGQPG